jgi:hypothetical protein
MDFVSWVFIKITTNRGFYFVAGMGFKFVQSGSFLTCVVIASPTQEGEATFIVLVVSI